MIRKMGSKTILTTDEELLLEQWILSKAVLGFPMHANEVKDSVQRVLKKSTVKIHLWMTGPAKSG